MVWAVDNDGQISKPDTCFVTVSSGAPLITKIMIRLLPLQLDARLFLMPKLTTGSSDNVMWLWDTGAPGWMTAPAVKHALSIRTPVEN